MDRGALLYPSWGPGHIERSISHFEFITLFWFWYFSWLSIYTLYFKSCFHGMRPYAVSISLDHTWHFTAHARVVCCLNGPYFFSRSARVFLYASKQTFWIHPPDFFFWKVFCGPKNLNYLLFWFLTRYFNMMV